MMSESECWLNDVNLVPLPWWGSKCVEMAISTELIRIPLKFILQPF